MSSSEWRSPLGHDMRHARVVGEASYDVGFCGVGRGGFDRRDHTGERSARLTLSPGSLRFAPSWWLWLSTSPFIVRPSELLLRPVNVKGSRYRLDKPDRWRVGIALLRSQPSAPLVLWPRTDAQALAIAQAATASGFTVEDQALSLDYEQIDVLRP